MIKKELLKKYVDLSLQIGINIQKGQALVIMSPIEIFEFTRLLVERAYELGASEVIVHWNDDFCKKMAFIHGDKKIFEEIPNWQVESLMHYANKGAAFLSIAANDPELLSGVDSEKIALYQKTRSQALKPYYDKIMVNELQWNIISVPTLAWAKKIFPGKSDEKAIDLLWEAILKSTKVTEENDATEVWKNHLKNLEEKMNYLNKKQFKKFRITNSLGTDLMVELPKNHIWASGKDVTKSGVEFVANIPTEEVFSMPHKYGVNGVVYASKPLNYGGNLIDNFSITFENGKIVKFTAEKGYEALENLISIDEGAKYLGEIALVPYDSPISNLGILFYNTLFDENASCHLAIGQAYSSCIENGDKLTPEEMEKVGMNDSLTHVDFMFGTRDLNIDAFDEDGNIEKIFINGNWA